jgi:RNA polymerase sporulation-specific sigma factor
VQFRRCPMRDLIILAKLDKDAKLEVLLRFEPLLKKTTNQYVKDFNLYNDAMQEGYATILKCIELYNPESKVEFPWYVKTAVTNNLMHFSRKIKTMFSLDSESATAEGLTFLDMLPADTNIEKEHIHKQELNAMYHAIKNLPEKQQVIIVEIFFKHKTMRSISKERGCHYNTVVNAKDSAINSLKKSLAGML